MQADKANHFKDLLEQKKQTLEKDVGIMKDIEVAEMDKYSPTELSNYDNHPADIGTELFQTELNYALKNHQKNQIHEVDNALNRIERGSYGTCSLCGKEIPEERLEAMPTADLCINCQKETNFHMDTLRRTRPIEESVLGNPFSKKNTYKHRDREIDGMGELYDVMKYGSSETPQDMIGYFDYDEYYTNELDRQGIVDPIDAISNEDYRRQLPD